MSNWKVLITDGLSSKGQSILSTACQVDDKNDISAEDLLKVIGEYDALIVRSRTKVTPEVFEAAKKLKVVGRAGVGVDNINLAAASAHNVRVVNAPKSTSVAVAELALSLMLALAHSITTADASMKSGQWLKKELKGVELDGKILGIIGIGNIGCALASRAAAMGMNVLGNDRYRTPEEIREYCMESVSLDELYARSDYISIHIPLTDESRNMIDGQTLAKMKRGVRIICTARGNIIDETALLAALESGQVAGAGLDVFSKEPPGLTALVAHPKVIATPHIGAQTAEAQVRAAEDIATEILAALRGEPLRWKVV